MLVAETVGVAFRLVVAVILPEVVFTVDEKLVLPFDEAVVVLTLDVTLVLLVDELTVGLTLTFVLDVGSVSWGGNTWGGGLWCGGKCKLKCGDELGFWLGE